MPNPRHMRRHSPRRACPTWCRELSGSSSGPRCVRQWSPSAPRPGPLSRAYRCVPRCWRRWRRGGGARAHRPRGGARGGGGEARRGGWEAWGAWVGRAEELGEGRWLVESAEELTRRAALQHAPTVDGVTLTSLHSAKGLEWDAVFLVGLVEGVLPTSYA